MLIIQRTLLPLLYILAATFADPDDMPLSLALDATYAGIHAPSALKHIIILGWVLLALATFTACLERCYKWPKTVVMFAGLSVLMAIMTFNALAVYEPYLAIRR